MGVAFAQGDESCGNGASGSRIMPAIEPNLMAGKAVDEPALAQPLHACGPIGLQHGRGAGVLALSKMPKGGMAAPAFCI